MPAHARYIVGIDLGTTNTVVAYADTAAEDVSVEVFEIEQLIAPGEIAARLSLPSVRYHPRDGELEEHDRKLPWHSDEDAVLGELALRRGSKVPGRIVTSAKSWLSHGAVDRTAAILPWGAADEVQKVSPVEASASYLRHLKRAWDARFPRNPLETQEVVVTVPASFDEGARALTLRAAKSAGLPKVRFVEEPQAAFYAWLDQRRDDLETALKDIRLVSVVDVGGGTTDLTLIQVELRENGPRLTRVAVGEHLMLGGDNMDLALAKIVEPKIAKGKKLNSARFHQLIQQCRIAKERLLSEDAPERAVVTVLGSGRALVGGTMKSEITRDEVHRLVLDGFFPEVDADARPEKRRGGIVEFGLPYVADAGITRHVTDFFARNDDVAREALGDRAPSPSSLAVPDAVLFNGGVFRGALLRERMRGALSRWRGAEVADLRGEDPDRAVARGAVAYGLARRGRGLKIGGGSARAYFLMVDRKSKDATGRDAVCVLPRGAEEGEEITLPNRTFSLKLGRPVRFHLASTPSEVRHVRPGELVEITADRYTDLPPIAAVLGEEDEGREIPVTLVSGLTEVGTLEMSCVHAEDAAKRFKLEFQLRGKGQASLSAQRVTQLHPRFAEATDRIRLVYGKSKGEQEVRPRDIKRLRPDLEKILGAREGWDPPLLREIWSALFAGQKRRRRSKDHERIWYHLIGYSLRPGFGYPLDEWRSGQLAALLKQSVQFPAEAQNWSEFWIMWRRIAGGLTAETQERLLSEIAFYLEPPSRRPRQKPKGPKKLGVDDMIRLAGSLERISAERKAKVGGWLVTRLIDHEDNPQGWWAVGRLGARVPFYGSAHNVVPARIALSWLEQAIRFDWTEVREAALAATLLARASGDRERDLDEGIRKKIAQRLTAADAPENWVAMVREVTHLDEADERRIFGDSLPPGLRLID